MSKEKDGNGDIINDSMDDDDDSLRVPSEIAGQHISHNLRDSIALAVQVKGNRRKTHIPDVKAYCSCACFKNCRRSQRRFSDLQSLTMKLEPKTGGILELLEWRPFPSGEHERSRGQNYLVCKTWVLTYALLEVENPDKQEHRNEAPVNDRFSELLSVAEDMGTELTNYSRAFFEMKHLFDQTHIHACPVHGMENCDCPEPEPANGPKALEKTLLLSRSGSNSGDFAKVRTGIRDLRDREWFQFKDRRDGFFLISTGLQEVTVDCRVLQKLLRDLAVLLEGAVSKNPFKWSIVPTIRWLKKYNKRMKTGKDLFSGEETSLYLDTREGFECIFYHGEMIVQEVTKLVLMIRMCYTFMKGGTGDVTFCLKLDNYEKILARKFNRDFTKLVTWVDFESNDFYKVPCPEALRRVPILVARKVEIGLFNEDYQTSKRKQSREQAKLAVDIANSRGSASTNRKSQIKNAYHREPKFAFNLKRLGSHHGKSAIEIDTKSLDLGKIQIEKK